MRGENIISAEGLEYTKAQTQKAFGLDRMFSIPRTK